MGRKGAGGNRGVFKLRYGKGSELELLERELWSLGSLRLVTALWAAHLYVLRYTYKMASGEEIATKLIA